MDVALHQPSSLQARYGTHFNRNVVRKKKSVVTFTFDMRVRLFDLCQSELMGNATVPLLAFISDTGNV